MRAAAQSFAVVRFVGSLQFPSQAIHDLLRHMLRVSVDLFLDGLGAAGV